MKARLLSTRETLGIILVAAVAVVLFSGCAQSHSGSRPTLPDDRPPTLSELAGTDVGVQAIYPPGAQGLWSEWAGHAVVSLAGPAINGNPDYPASIAFEAGWEGLDPDCFEDGSGHWTYDEATGDFYAHFDLGTGGTNFELTGTMTYEFKHVPANSSNPEEGRAVVSNWKVAHDLVAVGTWQVTPGPDCPATAFPAGTSGPYTGQEGSMLAAVALTAEDPGPMVRLTVVDLDTGDSDVAIVPMRDFLRGRVKVRVR